MASNHNAEPAQRMRKQTVQIENETKRARTSIAKHSTRWVYLMMSWALYGVSDQKGRKKSIFWTIIQLCEIVEFFFRLFSLSSCRPLLFSLMYDIDQPGENNKTMIYIMCMMSVRAKAWCIRVHEQTIINHEESLNRVQGFIQVYVYGRCKRNNGIAWKINRNQFQEEQKK